jgi:hypothetical protein
MPHRTPNCPHRDIPPSLSGCSRLELPSLSLPPALTTLLLDSNQFQSLPQENRLLELVSTPQLSALRHLDLSSNLLQQLHSLEGLTGLVSFELHHNRLVTVPPLLLPSLQYLALRPHLRPEIPPLPRARLHTRPQPRPSSRQTTGQPASHSHSHSQPPPGAYLHPSPRPQTSIAFSGVQ